MYMTLNKIIARRISTQMEEQNLLPAEQSRCDPWTRRCKDQLMLSKVTYEDCNMRKKNLCIAWTDYQKASDSVPCGLVENSIELVGAKSKSVRFWKSSMEKWNNRASANNQAGGNAFTAHSDTKRNIPGGIFLAITLLYNTYPINTWADQNWLQISSTWSWDENKSPYTDHLKLLGTSEERFGEWNTNYGSN